MSPFLPHPLPNPLLFSLLLHISSSLSPLLLSLILNISPPFSSFPFLLFPSPLPQLFLLHLTASLSLTSPFVPLLLSLPILFSLLFSFFLIAMLYALSSSTLSLFLLLQCSLPFIHLLSPPPSHTFPLSFLLFNYCALSLLSNLSHSSINFQFTCYKVHNQNLWTGYISIYLVPGIEKIDCYIYFFIHY